VEGLVKRLAEVSIPLDELNNVARKEAGFIRVPKLSNLHPYLARRPTATARVLTLAAVLPENVPLNEFIHAIGFDKVRSVPYGVLYLVNPDRRYVAELVRKYKGKEPKDVIVVDPMAGGGSIPLEALRLGFHTIAIEYNPVAYLILKASLEYPAKYGRKLYEDVKKE
jgi:putative DNA methylase